MNGEVSQAELMKNFIEPEDIGDFTGGNSENSESLKVKAFIKANSLVYGGEVDAYFMIKQLEQLKKDSNDWKLNDSHERQFE